MTECISRDVARHTCIASRLEQVALPLLRDSGDIRHDTPARFRALHAGIKELVIVGFRVADMCQHGQPDSFLIEVPTGKAERPLIPTKHDPGVLSELRATFATFRVTSSDENLQTFALVF